MAKYHWAGNNEVCDPIPYFKRLLRLDICDKKAPNEIRKKS